MARRLKLSMLGWWPIRMFNVLVLAVVLVWSSSRDSAGEGGDRPRRQNPFREEPPRKPPQHLPGSSRLRQEANPGVGRRLQPAQRPNTANQHLPNLTIGKPKYGRSVSPSGGSYTVRRPTTQQNAPPKYGRSLSPAGGSYTVRRPPSNQGNRPAGNQGISPRPAPTSNRPPQQQRQQQPRPTTRP